MQSSARYKPINTFSRRPCLNQIASYLIVALKNISFWALVQTNYANQSLRTIMIVLFSASTLLLVSVGLIASVSDPSDPVMVEYKNGNSSIVTKVGSPCLFCEHCESYVMASSRHCKVCDRCVQRFDHHCAWINNCIGQSNYCLFMIMIISVLANMVVYLASVGLLWREERWKQYLPSMVVSWLISVPVIILATLVFALILLHFFLIYRGVTTFDYIMSKRQAQIAPLPLQTNTYFTEPNQHNLDEIEPQVKRESSSQSQQNENENRRTQNQYPPPSAFQNIQNQQKSDFQSIGHIKSTKNKLENISENKKSSNDNRDMEELQIQNFNNFYQKHRGLRILVGPAVLVRPKRSESAKIIKRKNSFKSNTSKHSEEVYLDHIAVSDQNSDGHIPKTNNQNK